MQNSEQSNRLVSAWTIQLPGEFWNGSIALWNWFNTTMNQSCLVFWIAVLFCRCELPNCVMGQKNKFNDRALELQKCHVVLGVAQTILVLQVLFHLYMYLGLCFLNTHFFCDTWSYSNSISSKCCSCCIRRQNTIRPPLHTCVHGLPRTACVTAIDRGVKDYALPTKRAI